ncbi:nucleophile aminohydrolase [Apiosordaria backusii]|uniref:Nucleophile aminohydrolase n=1 Tax=Apiosordaria backusii TaxID=314023 RepID=A0AA40ES12_9PEZI|nr:nucleophile aminohydrolase [Apiosordaria backusii]
MMLEYLKMTTKIEYKPQSPTPNRFRPRVIIHGGAGNISPSTLPPHRYKQYRESLLTIITKTHHYMFTVDASNSFPSSLSTATYAVTLLEDNPLFNAGHGAVFTRDGYNELEASIMVSHPESYPKRGVGVTGLRRVRNPILLAKAILEHGHDDLLGRHSSPSSHSEPLDVPNAQGHTLLHGPAAEQLAKQYNLEIVPQSYFYTQTRWDEHTRALDREKQKPGEELATYSKEEYLPQGTVGAVTLDEQGVVTVATSTGGLTNKLTGRIGDTPSVGAGFWAENWAEKGNPSGVSDWKHRPGPAVVISDALRGLMADCLPTPFQHNPLPKTPRIVTTRSMAVSGTGNGDSFLRTAAARTVGAMARFGGISSVEAVSRVAGPGGELQNSAGDRWGLTGEGAGGIIGIETIEVQDDKGEKLDLRSEILQNFNCGGMFRAWVDRRSHAHVRVWREDQELPDGYWGEDEAVDLRNPAIKGEPALL